MPILNIDESYNVKSSPSSKNTSDKPILHDNTSNISVPPEREYVTQEQMKRIMQVVLKGYQEYANEYNKQ